MRFGEQMVAVAVGWQVYSIRRNPLDLGLVAGPAIGGVIFAVSPEAVYATAVALFGLALATVLSVRTRRLPREVEDAPPSYADLVAGIGFMLRTRMLLGAISLDLFAVLF